MYLERRWIIENSMATLFDVKTFKHLRQVLYVGSGQREIHASLGRE